MEQLREFSKQLVEVDKQLDELNSQRQEKLKQKNHYLEQIQEIIKKPEYNAVNEISLGENKKIVVKREWKKPWSLSKGFLNDLIRAYFLKEYPEQPKQEVALIHANKLINFIIKNVEEEICIKELKLELR